MTKKSNQHRELWDLLEGLCENTLTDEQLVRLDEIVVSDEAARELYLRYINLHGTLHYDTAVGSGELPVFDFAPIGDDDEIVRSESKTWWYAVGVITAAAVLLVAVALNGGRNQNQSSLSGNTELIKDVPIVGDNVESAEGPKHTGSIASDSAVNLTNKKPTAPNLDEDRKVVATNTLDGTANPQPTTASSDSTKIFNSDEVLVEYINERIEEAWKLADVEPAEQATDAEWLRRVHLDLVGHIPSLEKTTAFLADDSEGKRARMVAELLDDPGYIRNWTTIWTKLLIGRSNSRSVDRRALQKYLRESFARNRAWDEMVTEFVTAEGQSNENGATNFLLAKLDNQARPKIATAAAQTAQVFMGIQIQCMQCHDHPYNDWKMESFWQVASFFQDLKDERVRQFNAKTRQREFQFASLKSGMISGPIQYEKRNGLMQVAFPKLFHQRPSKEVTDGYEAPRPALAKLMFEGEKPLGGLAIVNRMWHHFFGHAFTARVDDMGPHAHPSHPELLNTLTANFVRSGFDLKRLMTWICLSDAYQLSSRFNDTNVEDDPARGFDPLFSRAYVRQMTAEQLYDSLLVATKAHETVGSDWTKTQDLRQQWLQQFVMTFDTDEVNEASLFNGTVPQALMLMNGDLIDKAVSLERGTLLRDLLIESKDEKTLIKQLSLTALSREPTPVELTRLERLLQSHVSSRSPRTLRNDALLAALQDVFWAYLNSNEFILVH